MRAVNPDLALIWRSALSLNLISSDVKLGRTPCAVFKLKVGKLSGNQFPGGDFFRAHFHSHAPTPGRYIEMLFPLAVELDPFASNAQPIRHLKKLVGGRRNHVTHHHPAVRDAGVIDIDGQLSCFPVEGEPDRRSKVSSSSKISWINWTS